MEASGRPVSAICTHNRVNEIITLSTAVCEVIMDDSVIAKTEGCKRLRRSLAEKRRIVEYGVLLEGRRGAGNEVTVK